MANTAHKIAITGQVRCGTPTGDYKGSGTINALGIYENNIQVALKSATSVTGSRSGGTALTNLLTVLAAAGIITDNTTA